MQFGLHQSPADITQKIVTTARLAMADEIMLFFFAEELNDGHDTLERIDQWIEHSRPYRQALQEAGVALSLNPWHSLLHTDRFRQRKPDQRWQGMVDQHGTECTAVVCPLDADWRAYYAETLRRYAREHFRVIWIDDDIRFHNHGPLDWGGCFCPLHVAEFNRRYGLQATRAAIVANCTAPGEPHPWRAMWMDMWDDTQLALITNWRNIVEAEGCRLGLMSSEMGQHAAEGRYWERWWQAFGGDQPPVHRPHFWGYGECAGADLPEFIMRLDQNRSIQPEAIESDPEIECFNYGRWNKPFRQIGAQMALAHILGSTGLNISLYDFMGNDPDDEPERAEFLCAWRPTLDWLADQFPMSLQPMGIGVPWSQEMGRRKHTDGSGNWQSLVCSTRGWGRWLMGAGLACTARPAPAVNAIAGPVAWSCTDEQLHAWLAQGLLLDGGAAHILLQRGFGPHIGVRDGRMITQADACYSVEECRDPAFSLRTGAGISVNAGPYAATIFQGDLLPGVRLASMLCNPTHEDVGHGLTLFENALGGRVAIVPWQPHDFVVAMTIQRAVQLRNTLRYLAGNSTLGAAEGGPWLTPQFLTDGTIWRGAVWNTSPDAIRAITLTLPEGMPVPTAAVHVDGEGQRHAAQLRDGQLQLDRPLHQWEFVVLTDA
jgi:hypothetical protein